MTLPAFAAELRRAYSTAPAAFDRYILPARRPAANPPVAVAAVDRWYRQTDGQTDGRTDTRPIHRPCAAEAASVNKTGLERQNKSPVEMSVSSGVVRASRNVFVSGEGVYKFVRTLYSLVVKVVC